MVERALKMVWELAPVGSREKPLFGDLFIYFFQIDKQHAVYSLQSDKQVEGPTRSQKKHQQLT